MTKFLLLLSFFVLLGGCVTPIPCPPPGQPNLSDKICHYVLWIETVVKEEEGKYKVTAKVPDSVLDANEASWKSVGKADGSLYDVYPRDNLYTFFVSTNIEIKQELHFHREPHRAGMTDTYDNDLQLSSGENGFQ